MKKITDKDVEALKAGKKVTIAKDHFDNIITIELYR